MLPPHVHLLLLISTALGGFSGHLEHHLAAALSSPGSPKEGPLLLHMHHLRAGSSKSTIGNSKLLMALRSLDLVGARHAGHVPPQWHRFLAPSAGASHEHSRAAFKQGEQNTWPQGPATSCRSPPVVGGSKQMEHSPSHNSSEQRRFLVD